MADNTVINVGTGGDTIATDDIGGGVKVPRTKVGYGVDGAYADVTPANPLPVTVASPDNVTGNGPTSVTAATSDTLLLAASTTRLGATFYNDSTASLYLSLGTNAASTTAFTARIAANGGYYETPFGYAGQVRGIWSAVNGAVRVTEVVP
jgi:hypothetical protein